MVFLSTNLLSKVINTQKLHRIFSFPYFFFGNMAENQKSVEKSRIQANANYVFI
jgi:hypothetical protein